MAVPSARAFQETTKAETRAPEGPDYWRLTNQTVGAPRQARIYAAILGLTQFFLEIARFERDGWPTYAWTPRQPCEECTRRRDRGCRHGIYLRECNFPREGDDAKAVLAKEQTYGPYCSPRCVRVAVHCDDVIRTRTYSMGYYTAKDAKIFHATSIDPFKARELANARKR